MRARHLRERPPVLRTRVKRNPWINVSLKGGCSTFQRPPPLYTMCCLVPGTKDSNTKTKFVAERGTASPELSFSKCSIEVWQKPCCSRGASVRRCYPSAGALALNQLDQLPLCIARWLEVSLSCVQAGVAEHVLHIPKRAARKRRLSRGLGSERSPT